MVHEGARVQKGSASMRLQRCFAIKSGVNGLLDVARRIYCEIVDDIEDMVAAMAEDTGTPDGKFHASLQFTELAKRPTGLSCPHFLVPKFYRLLITHVPNVYIFEINV